MTTPIARILAALAVAAIGVPLQAHPGSGIALDRGGNVYFVDTGAGVWKLDASGKLELHARPAFHWMALDLDGRFAGARLLATSQAEMLAAGANPGVVLSSDYPVAIGGDGALYYAEPGGRDGPLSLMRVEAGGRRAVFARLPGSSPSGPLRWLNGIAARPGGGLLFTSDTAIHKIDARGTVSDAARRVAVPDCAPPPLDDPDSGPGLRGLAEDRDGTIWVAATGCSALVRVSPDGAASVALRAEKPWSPTAVAVAAGGVYVLEYLHTPGDDRRAWVPRVRRISPQGKVETLAQVRRDAAPR